jgi:hypothetical protein
LARRPSARSSDQLRALYSIFLSFSPHCLHIGVAMGKPLGSPNAQSYPRLAPIGELHASSFENLTKAINRTLAYSFTTLEPCYRVG